MGFQTIKKSTRPNRFLLRSTLVALFLVLGQNASPQQVELIRRQGSSQGAEEAQVVRSVVDHEEDAGQQLIGHEQVVKVRPLVVLAAVAATPLHQRSKVVSVPCKKKKVSQ